MRNDMRTFALLLALFPGLFWTSVVVAASDDMMMHSSSRRQQKNNNKENRSRSNTHSKSHYLEKLPEEKDFLLDDVSFLIERYLQENSLPTRAPTRRPQPQPTTPAPIQQCVDEQQTVLRCFDALPDGGAACANFLNTNIPLGCAAGQDEFCSTIDAASPFCGDCDNGIVALTNCVFGCSYDCDGVVVTPAPTTSSPTRQMMITPEPTATCTDERQAVSTCFGALDDGGAACATCLNANLPFGCMDGQDVFCAALADCPCGGCGQTVETLINCQFQCRYDCGIGL